MNAPVISDLAPATLIRRSPTDPDQPFVEQVRLSSIVQQSLLPSISMSMPSRLRDSLRILLAAGAPEADFILARAPGVCPWDLDHPSVAEMFIAYFNATQGAFCVFPDAGGPWPRSYSTHPAPNLYERQTRLLQTARLYSPYITDNYQIGLMDMVIPPKDELESALFSLRGSDIAMCTWSGSFRDMRKHGWRSACAAIGSFASPRVETPTHSLIGHTISLGAGRKIVQDRSTLFGAPKGEPMEPDIQESCVVLKIHPVLDRAHIQSEMTFRRPMFEWPLPVMRTMKLIHKALSQAADLFVFRPVREIEAIALKTAIELVLQPFHDYGIVVGPDGSGRPTVSGRAIRDRETPMLSCDISAQVRPWCQSVSLRVMVKSGSQPLISEN
jgi:hypothetical protein